MALEASVLINVGGVFIICNSKKARIQHTVNSQNVGVYAAKPKRFAE